MSIAHVQIKLGLDKNPAKAALEALEKDPKNTANVFIAEKTHKRLEKLKENDGAKKYFEVAKTIYPYSTYFDGAKKDN